VCAAISFNFVRSRRSSVVNVWVLRIEGENCIEGLYYEKGCLYYLLILAVWPI
jgi:hypothetical protein